MAARTCFHSVLAIILLIACIGCATKNDVVSSGFIQKRKYRPGWHVDLGSHREHATNAHRSVRGGSKIAAGVPILRGERLLSDIGGCEEAVVSAGIGEKQVIRPKMKGMVLADPGVDQPTADPLIIAGLRRTADAPANIARPGTDRPMNWLAPISLLVTVGGAVVGIALGSNPIAIGAVAVGFILGLISARRCRDRGRSGQGFAIAALIISTLLIVLTLISLAAQ